MYNQQNDEQPAVVDNLAAALPCKTPVSLLQELCMRRGISPKYDLLQIEGAVHEPTFVYRVTVGEFTANGSGQSKKKAKHSAAKAVLDIIIHGGGPAGQAAAAATSVLNNSNESNSTAVTHTSEGQTGDLSGMVVSPYDDGIPGNPVGQLQELCMTRRWPPPTYELTKEEGFPHERNFSIACTIATHKEIGGGKSKKLAKRQAAYSMLQKLRELPQGQEPNSGLNDDDDDLAQKLALRYSGLKESKVMSLTGGDSRKEGEPLQHRHQLRANAAGDRTGSELRCHIR
uniref:RISC-loading complex subunit tarbp2-like n=1 Tax=Hirondellea gigas TaxID=1518452 RepID=A0A2P2HWH3_9CRUS